MNYIEALAHAIRERTPSADIPQGDVDSLFLMYAVLAQAKGADVTNKDVHDAWAAWMTASDPSHEALVPYDDLPPDVRAEDSVYVRAIRDAVNSQS